MVRQIFPCVCLFRAAPSPAEGSVTRLPAEGGAGPPRHRARNAARPSDVPTAYGMDPMGLCSRMANGSPCNMRLPSGTTPGCNPEPCERAAGTSGAEARHSRSWARICRSIRTNPNFAWLSQRPILGDGPDCQAGPGTTWYAHPPPHAAVRSVPNFRDTLLKTRPLYFILQQTLNRFVG